MNDNDVETPRIVTNWLCLICFGCCLPVVVLLPSDLQAPTPEETIDTVHTFIKSLAVSSMACLLIGTVKAKIDNSRSVNSFLVLVYLLLLTFSVISYNAHFFLFTHPPGTNELDDPLWLYLISDDESCHPVEGCP